jgi:hypothetical protein
MVSRFVVASFALLLAASSAAAAELCPKYGACVPAEAFECEEITRSSFITRICYDAGNEYMVLRLRATDYHYCSIDPATVAAFKAAESMGRFYNQHIKSGRSDGPFDCRTHPVPAY